MQTFANGTVTPGEAQAAASMFEVQRKAVETVDLKTRKTRGPDAQRES